MNKINWKTRLLNEKFWVALIPAVFILVQQILKIFGIDFDAGTWAATIVAIIDSVFAILTIIGIVNDPNTKGWGDSKRSRKYDKPWDDKENEVALNEPQNTEEDK